MTRKIGICVAANNIERDIVERFQMNALRSLKDGDELEIVTGPTFGPYNKSRHINDGLRMLLKKSCDIIVQTDIDVIVTQELVEETRLRTEKGKHLWIPFLKKGKIRMTATGSWNALVPTDWITLGGYDERCFGWGFEDDDFHRRSNRIGLKREIGTKFPVHHDHPARQTWDGRIPIDVQRERNVQRTLDNNFVNYLTDKIPRHKGITLHLTSRCQRQCAECCLQDFMAIEPDYCITEREIDDFISAMELSPYEADRVILCGGEPLLCPTLPYAIERLNACERIRNVTLYTGLVDGFDLQSLPDIRGEIRVSEYGTNHTLLQEAMAVNPKIKTIDKRFHIVMADRIYPEIVPGTCYNPEVFIYQGRAYACPMTPQNLVRHKIAPYDSPLYSEPLTNRFFDRLRGWKTGGMPNCGGCAGNHNLYKVMGGHRNDREKEEKRLSSPDTAFQK